MTWEVVQERRCIERVGTEKYDIEKGSEGEEWSIRRE